MRSTMPVHPDPAKKLFGFIMRFGNGDVDYGLAVGTDKETVLLQLENATLAAYAVEAITDQQQFIDAMLEYYGGVIYFTTTPTCN